MMRDVVAYLLRDAMEHIWRSHMIASATHTVGWLPYGLARGKRKLLNHADLWAIKCNRLGPPSSTTPITTNRKARRR